MSQSDPYCAFLLFFSWFTVTYQYQVILTINNYLYIRLWQSKHVKNNFTRRSPIWVLTHQLLLLLNLNIRYRHSPLVPPPPTQKKTKAVVLFYMMEFHFKESLQITYGWNNSRYKIWRSVLEHHKNVKI